MECQKCPSGIKKLKKKKTYKRVHQSEMGEWNDIKV